MSKSGNDRKPRKCKMPEDVLIELAGTLQERFFDYTEVERLIKATGFKCTVTSLLNFLDARGYLVASEKRKTDYGSRTAYRVMTKEIYIKIEEEYRENARKRILETVSC